MIRRTIARTLWHLCGGTLLNARPLTDEETQELVSRHKELRARELGREHHRSNAPEALPVPLGQEMCEVSLSDLGREYNCPICNGDSVQAIKSYGCRVYVRFNHGANCNLIPIGINADWYNTQDLDECIRRSDLGNLKYLNQPIYTGLGPIWFVHASSK